MLGIILILIAAVFAVRIAYGIGRETAMTHIHFEKQKSFDEGFEIGHKKGYELGEKKRTNNRIRGWQAIRSCYSIQSKTVGINGLSFRQS